MGDTSTPSTETSFEAFIREYGRAFDNYDLNSILSYYHTPYLVFKAGKVIANLTKEDTRRYVENLLATYRQNDYAKAETPEIEIKPLGLNSALVTVRWVCLRSDGSTLWDFWDSYHLIRIDGKWKILADTVHDSANASGYSSESAS